MKKIIFLFVIVINHITYSQELPNGFVYLSDIDSSIKKDLRYLTSNNFIGKPIDGYHKNCVIITLEAANALKEIQAILLKDSLGLKIYDAYRPQQAVNHFVHWAKVLNDTVMKTAYYPNLPKNKLFQLGYIASKSGHTRGSTVDLTIINLDTKKELDMGFKYDFFGEQSHPFYQNITENQKKNRLFLRKTMLENGFKPYDSEWWHFTFRKEPFPNTYFDFPIE